MKRTLALAFLAMVGISACDGGPGDTAGINSLGTCFVTAFNQQPNDEPLQLDTCTLTFTPMREPFTV